MTSVMALAVQQTALTFLSAVLFVGFFELNSLMFQAFEHREGINWVFLPAGCRVILVLLLGLPGALGLMLGDWFLGDYLFRERTHLQMLLDGVASGLTPWLVMKFLQKQQWLSEQLQHLSTLQLLNLTLATSAATAMAHQLFWLWLDKPQANIWVDIWPMFIGNVTGALLMLYGFKFTLDRMRGQN